MLSAQIITKSRKCFNIQSFLELQQQPVVCKRLQRKYKVCMYMSVCRSLGRSVSFRLSQTFQDVFCLLFYPFSTVKYAVLLFTASSTLLLKTHGCYSCDTVCYTYTQAKFYSIFVSTECSAVQQFSLKRNNFQRKKESSHTFKYRNCLLLALLLVEGGQSRAQYLKPL